MGVPLSPSATMSVPIFRFLFMRLSGMSLLVMDRGVMLLVEFLLEFIVLLVDEGHIMG